MHDKAALFVVEVNSWKKKDSASPQWKYPMKTLLNKITSLPARSNPPADSANTLMVKKA